MINLNFIHTPGHKSITKHKKTERAPLPKKVVLSLSQHTGAPSEPVVKVGDIVTTGALIAKASGFISSNLHSSISGKVVAIGEASHPILDKSNAITIESEGEENLVSGKDPKDIASLKKEDIINIVKDAGIVGLGGAAFPTFVKLSPPGGKKIDTIIINGAECEPFLTCDYRLMLEKPKEIMLGASLISKALDVKEVIIGVEDNKLDAIENLGSALFKVNIGDINIKVKKLPTRYPQGGEKQLIKTLLDKEVPSGGLPLDIGCVVSNVQTIFSIYEAVYLNKPLYERVITVSGKFLKEPKNILARIGTPVRDLLEFCGLDVKKDIYKIVMGGPMTGFGQYDLDAPIVKGTSGILVFDKKDKKEEEIDCVRCSRCIDSCPSGLMPCMIAQGMRFNRTEISNEYDPLDCIECGSCSYVCPSKIDLVQFIKLAKIKARDKK
ncbi:MAG: electron transport complex subunit RsxC [Candidatus Omnitrophota bacterium]